ncbi:MAG: LuxR C-terminal-related transcriptional regulator [Propionicimonas sp.]
MTEGVCLAAKAVRWLESGRDVLVRSDDAAQGAAFLADLAAEAELQGFVTSTLGVEELGPAAEARPAAFADRRARPDRASHRPGRTVWMVEYSSEFNSTAAERLARALRRSRAQLVTTTTFDLVGHSESPLGKLVAGRGPAELRIPGLSYTEMMTHVAARLGGPVDARLVSSVLAWSGGLPSVASAVLDAGRFASVITLVDRAWTLVGDLSTIPLDPVAHLLCARLSAPEVQALTVLSVMGPADQHELRSVVPSDLLERLQSQHRVIVNRGPRGTRFSVSPPALAEALRLRAPGAASEEFAATSGPDDARSRDAPGQHDLLSLLLSPDIERHREFEQRASQLMAMAQEASRRREAAARDQWQRSHDIEDAVAYLSVLLQRPTRRAASEVFASTQSLPGTELAERLQLLELRWLRWLGKDHPTWQEFCARHQHDQRPIERINEIVRSVLETPATPLGDAELEASIPLSAHELEPVRSLAYAREATALLESGRLTLALRLTDPVNRPGWLMPDLQVYLDGVHLKTLLALGRVREVLTLSRAGLARALDELDPNGIRVYAVGLAQSLVAVGRSDAAGTLLFTALRLGPSGPIGGGFYEQLVIGAAAHTTCEESAGASRLLATELVDRPAENAEMVGATRQIAQACLLRLDADNEQADALLWAAGERFASQGRLHSALLVWSQLSAVSTKQQLEAIRAAVRVRPEPLLSRVFAVQEALFLGDLAAVVRTASAVPMGVSPPLAEAVLAFVEDHRRRTGSPPLGRHERIALVGDALDRWLEDRARGRRVVALSAREREIARLVAEGHTNQEIAALLGVSQRTVENHVYRSRKKLHIVGRDEFRSLRV